MTGSRHIALFIHGLSGGGVQRSTVNLATALVARGHRVDLVVGTSDGASRSRVPEGVRLITLRRSWRWQFWPLVWAADPGGRPQALRPVLLPLVPQKALYYLRGLVRYLEDARPDTLISADTYCNIVAVWARSLAGTATRVVISERNALSVQLARPERRRAWRWRHVPPLIARTYPQADAIVAVSEGLAGDLAQVGAVPRERIRAIYNPVFPGPLLDRRAAEPVDHPWLEPGAPPVVLGVGRLVRPKDFATLIRAFAETRRRGIAARLIILGEEQTAGERDRLRTLAAGLGIAAEVDLPGFAENPFAYMARAGVFVLSSEREGLGNVVIEALACGCPVVSTDCPHGPAEILDGGRYGRLVPVGDPSAMAGAIASALTETPDRAALRARGAQFSFDRAAAAYLALADPAAAITKM